MPYISKNNDRREKLRKGEPALNAGELNYQIFHYVKHYYEKHKNIVNGLAVNILLFVEKFLGEKPNYQRYNDMTGVLVRCYKEINRRLNVDKYFIKDLFIKILELFDERINKYEDTKIISNGDVE